jgi:hypothetical protein
MPFINLPPSLKMMWDELDKRVRKLEQSPPKRPYIILFDTTSQVIASTTVAYAVTYNTVVEGNHVSLVSNSRITVERTGVYNLEFSMQLQNTDSQAHTVDIWFAKNGTNVADSNSRIDVPAKHGSDNGVVLAAWNYLTPLNANDYLQLFWRSASTAVSMPYLAAGTSPTRPATPSVIVSLHEVAW